LPKPPACARIAAAFQSRGGYLEGGVHVGGLEPPFSRLLHRYMILPKIQENDALRVRRAHARLNV